MNGWGWVAAGYGTLFGALAIYMWTLARRTVAAQRRLDSLD